MSGLLVLSCACACVPVLSSVPEMEGIYYMPLGNRGGASEPVWRSGKQKALGSIPLRLSFLIKKVMVCGHCLVTLSLTINETLKWLSSLPILMQKSFWW